MFIKILIIVVVLLAVLVVFVATRPAGFHVSRSATLAAPAGRVFAQVNDLHKWQEFSPWAKLDPKAKTTYEGPPAGEGAVFNWDGDKNVGAGRMTITESRPSELVRFRLEFYRPFVATNEAIFTFAPAVGGGTTVTWVMNGKNNFISKAVGLIMDCEKMVGGQFEEGLGNLRRIVEQPATPAGDA